MDYATTLHGHPATVHTKIIRNFPVVGHFEYGYIRLFANLQRSDAFFPPQRISRVNRRRRNRLRWRHAQLRARQRENHRHAHRRTRSWIVVRRQRDNRSRCNQRPRRRIVLQSEVKIATGQERRHRFRFSQRLDVAFVYLFQMIAAGNPDAGGKLRSSGLPAASRPSAKAARRATGEPVPIDGPPAKRVSTARPRTRRDRKTHRRIPPAGSLRSPAADFVRSTGYTVLLRPFFPDTPPEPRGRQEMWTRSPAAALPPALCAIAESSVRSQRRARTRSLLRPSWSRKLQTVSAPPRPVSSAPPLLPRAASPPNSESRRPCAQSPRSSPQKSSIHTLPPGSPHGSSACANRRIPAAPHARPDRASPPLALPAALPLQLAFPRPRSSHRAPAPRHLRSIPDSKGKRPAADRFRARSRV